MLVKGLMLGVHVSSPLLVSEIWGELGKKRSK